MLRLNVPALSRNINTGIAVLALTGMYQSICAQSTILGKTDIAAYLNEAPGVPKSLEEAGHIAYGADILNPDSYAIDQVYDPYDEKVNQKGEELMAYSRAKMERSGSTEEDYRAQALEDVNSNPIIANMGGIDKISEMSEEEAREAAMLAAAEMMANPGGNGQSGVAAMYQKLASDPAYAAKFEKMSDAEKQAEMAKYMSTAPVAKTPAQQAEDQARAQKSQKEADLIRNAQEIQLKIVEWNQMLLEVQNTYAEAIAGISSVPGSHAEINAAFEPKFAAVPEVVLGEMREKDPALLGPLYLSSSAQHKERARQELTLYQAALSARLKGYLEVVKSYRTYLSQNSGKVYDGTSAADMMHGINTELPLVSFEGGLLSLGLELSKASKDIVRDAAQWEQYAARMQHTYGK